MAAPFDTSVARARENAELLSATISVPQHVVYRTFPAETVLLNLQTGRYHGLNVTAGRVLAALDTGATVREAVGSLAREFRADPALVRHDVCELCRLLIERGLVEVDGGA